MMKRLVLLASMLCLLLAVTPVFAEKDADIDWGNDYKSGHWGFVYTKGPDDEEGSLQTYFNIQSDQSRWRKQFDGAYIDGGQSLTTMFGTRLGVNYSPYVAQFHGESTVLGLRIYTFKWNDWSFDGTYVIAHTHQNNHWNHTPAIVGPMKQDILLGAKGSIGDASITAALVRQKLDDEFYFNYSVVADVKPMPDLSLTLTYAGYQANEDWLYNVDATWKYMPGKLEFRAGLRNSEIDAVDSKAVRGSGFTGGEESKSAYVNKSGRDAINKIYNRDNSVNVGATTWFNLGPVSNKLDVDYDTTNPSRRGDLDDFIKVALNSTYEGFTFNQRATVLVPDEKTTNRASTIEDTDALRYDYAITVTTPKYNLANGFTAQGRLDFDWDMNYTEDNRYHTVAGLLVNGTTDIWRLKKVQVDGRVIVDMPMDKDLIEDPVKFAVQAKYDAPNGVKFRVEYYSSNDYSKTTTWVHGEELQKRYEVYRFYAGNDTPQGLRVIAGIPF